MRLKGTESDLADPQGTSHIFCKIWRMLSRCTKAVGILCMEALSPVLPERVSQAIGQHWRPPARRSTIRGKSLRWPRQNPCRQSSISSWQARLTTSAIGSTITIAPEAGTDSTFAILLLGDLVPVVPEMGETQFRVPSIPLVRVEVVALLEG